MHCHSNRLGHSTAADSRLTQHAQQIAPHRGDASSPELAPIGSGSSPKLLNALGCCRGVDAALLGPEMPSTPAPALHCCCRLARLWARGALSPLPAAPRGSPLPNTLPMLSVRLRVRCCAADACLELVPAPSNSNGAEPPCLLPQPSQPASCPPEEEYRTRSGTSSASSCWLWPMPTPAAATAATEAASCAAAAPAARLASCPLLLRLLWPLRLRLRRANRPGLADGAALPLDVGAALLPPLVLACRGLHSASPCWSRAGAARDAERWRCSSA